MIDSFGICSNHLPRMASTSNSSSTLSRSLPPSRRRQGKGPEAPPFRRTVSLPQKSRRQVPSTSAIQHDAKDVAEVLAKIQIKFTSCTFTYTKTHLQGILQQEPGRKPSRLDGLVARLGHKKPEQCSIHEYKSCIFFPNDGRGQEMVQSFITQKFTDVAMIFENCIFVERESSLMETVLRKLRQLWNNYIPFKLIYRGSEGPPLGLVQNSVFRLKDIADVTSYILTRIVDRSDYFVLGGEGPSIASLGNSIFL